MPVLAQESQHATASKRIANLFTRSHYKQFKLDDAFSSVILTSIWRIWTTAATCFWPLISAALKSTVPVLTPTSRGRLAPAYEMFNLSQQRRYERFEYALKLLDTPFDFTQPDNYIFDREGRPGRKTKPNSTSCGASGQIRCPEPQAQRQGVARDRANCLASVTTTPSSGCPRPRARTCSSSS